MRKLQRLPAFPADSPRVPEPPSPTFAFLLTHPLKLAETLPLPRVSPQGGWAEILSSTPLEAGKIHMSTLAGDQSARRQWPFVWFLGTWGWFSTALGQGPHRSAARLAKETRLSQTRAHPPWASWAPACCGWRPGQVSPQPKSSVPRPESHCPLPKNQEQRLMGSLSFC